MATPALALDAVKLELVRMADIGRAHALAALSERAVPAQRLVEQQRALAALGVALETFIARLERERLREDQARRLPVALRVNAYIEEIARLAQHLARHGEDVERIRCGPIARSVDDFVAAAAALVRCADFDAPAARADESAGVGKAAGVV